MNGDNQIYVSLVGAALLNKYDGTDACKISEVVSATTAEITGNSEDAMLRRLRPVEGPVDDIQNQVVTLSLIKRFWSKPPKLEMPLTMLNGCSFGTPLSAAFRSTAHVEDYGGVLPTPTAEVQARLDELERLCRCAVSTMTRGSTEDKALILAYIHGALVRIHPFADGNGRTARMFIFYALACWDLPLFPIPKVRNDPAWKHAMQKAVAGEVVELKEQLLSRMISAGQSVPIQRR